MANVVEFSGERYRLERGGAWSGVGPDADPATTALLNRHLPQVLRGIGPDVPDAWAEAARRSARDLVGTVVELDDPPVGDVEPGRIY